MRRVQDVAADGRFLLLRCWVVRGKGKAPQMRQSVRTGIAAPPAFVPCENICHNISMQRNGRSKVARHWRKLQVRRGAARATFPEMAAQPLFAVSPSFVEGCMTNPGCLYPRLGIPLGPGCADSTFTIGKSIRFPWESGVARATRSTHGGGSKHRQHCV